MNLSECLDDLAAKGVVFSLERDRLQCHIPKGMSAEQVAAVVAGNKEEIIRLLNRGSRKARATTAEQGTITGPVPLTPIQQWFFAQEFAHAHHWNQCILLELTRPTAVEDVLEV